MMKHSSHQCGNQFSEFGCQSEKFSHIGACIRCNFTHLNCLRFSPDVCFWFICFFTCSDAIACYSAARKYGELFKLKQTRFVQCFSSMVSSIELRGNYSSSGATDNTIEARVKALQAQLAMMPQQGKAQKK